MDESPWEDFVFFSLRRISQGLTGELAKVNPLVMLIIIILSGLTATIYITAIAQTISQITSRDYAITTKD